MWKLFTGDMRRITGNVVSIIIVIGLVAIPGLFTWFNVAASWDPFANTKNLKFAVASEDTGYTSDLIPVKITIGDQVENTLRANGELDWTFTSTQDAIDGTKSGKYYAAVIIGKDFSRNMMTFFSNDVHHARLTYYTNEKKNALAPKVTGQGADQVAAQVNQMFAQTMTSTALSIASQLSKELNSPKAKTLLTNFNANIADIAGQLSQTATTLGAYGSLTTVAQSLLASSNALLSSASESAGSAGTQLQQSQKGVHDLAGALTSASSTLSTALSASSGSYGAVSDGIDSTFANAGKSASDASASLREQEKLVDQQISQYEAILKALTAIHQQYPTIPMQQLLDSLQSAIDTQTSVRDALGKAADQVDASNSAAQAQHAHIKALAHQATSSISSLQSSFNDTLKPQINTIAQSVLNTASILNGGADSLNKALDGLTATSTTASNDLASVRTTLNTVASLLNATSSRLNDFSRDFTTALNGNDMAAIRKLLGKDPDALAAMLSAPMQVSRHAVFPVANFGTALTPFYTFLPLWVGALLMAVTLKTSVSRKTRAALGDPRPHQLYLGHFGVFAAIALLQSTFSCGGSLLFLGVHAVHPLLFMLDGWISSLVYTFFIYTLVVSFGNVGKAIGVIFLVVQISGSGGAYPLQVLPRFIGDISPFLPVTHSIQAMRAAIAGIYRNDYLTQIGWLLAFIPPMLLLGLVLRKALVRFNRWYMAKVESTKLL
jgi:putative membrane protein